MPVAPLGPDRLAEVFERSCRLVLANQTSAEKAVTILAAAFIRHHQDESTHMRSFYGLDLGPGSSGVFDNDRPSSLPVVLIEALIRVRTDDRAGVVDAYAAV